MRKYYVIFTISILFLCANIFGIAQNYNQVGYKSKSVKRIFFPEVFQNKDFSVVNNNGEQVYASVTTRSSYWDLSGTNVCIANFSELNEEGTYILKIEDQEVEFKIDNSIYQSLGKDVVKMFYYARASMPLEDKYAGKFSRPEGHPDNHVLIHYSAISTNKPEGSIISSSGGWYDAGDYNKYIVNSAITTYTFLQLIDLYGDNIKDVNLNIPESNNQLSDIIDETLYNLRWMLTMQDTSDGGVYHKLTSKNFCSMKMPHQDKLPRYVVMKSTAATLDFAATMAKAARTLQVYNKTLPGLSDSCNIAAQRAWSWATKNPDVLYVQPIDITTGEYKDKEIDDEWLWAASELYLMTGASIYQQEINLNRTFNIPQWGTVSTLALYSISTSENVNKEVKDQANINLKRLAEKYYENYKKSAYRISIKKFPWGSNGEISNQGILFIHAYKLTGEIRYLEAADACLGYLLGANPTGYCFVTGYGKKSPVHIHERRSVSDGIEEPIPGFLVGGATLQSPGDCGQLKYPSKYPAKAYLDEECSYSTNEIAINWNAPFAFLLWALDAELK